MINYFTRLQLHNTLKCLKEKAFFCLNTIATFSGLFKEFLKYLHIMRVWYYSVYKNFQTQWNVLNPGLFSKLSSRKQWQILKWQQKLMG